MRGFRRINYSFSLLLSTTCSIFLLLARNNLAKHDDTIAIHKSNTRKALTVLERIAYEGLLRLKTAFGHLVGLKRVRVFHLLAASLFPHFPNDLRYAARSPATAHET